MSPLDFVRAHYGHDGAFDAWLRRVRDLQTGHGSELVHALGSPRNGRPGMSDNVYAAERCLREAVEAGWLKRGHLRPTVEQDFFDVNRSFKLSPETSWVACYYSAGPNMPAVLGAEPAP